MTKGTLVRYTYGPHSFLATIKSSKPTEGHVTIRRDDDGHYVIAAVDRLEVV